jgi:SAM-dependent methyltransferase
MVKNLSAQTDFPVAAPGLSYLAMARKPENWAGPARPSNVAAGKMSGSSALGSRNGAANRNGAGPAAAPRLNVGCGNQIMPGWLGIDSVRTEASDIVRDITRGLPFVDSSVAEIYCDNALEHIGPNDDFVFVLNEFYRVLKPGGTATIIVPYGRSQAAWQDPTHQRAFVPRSALYWNQDLQWPKLYGITANFDVEVQEYGDRETEAFLKFVCKARPK